MEKLLFIVSGYYPDSRSGAQVVKRLAEELKSSYDITIYTLDNDLKSYCNDIINNIKVIRNSGKSENKLLRALGRVVSINKRIVYCNMIDIYKETSSVVKIIKNYKIPTVISFCYPIESHLVAATAKKYCDFKWCAYYLDPFFSNQQLEPELYDKRKKMETALLEAADRIIAYDLILHDFKREELFLEKLREIYLPGIFDYKVLLSKENNFLESDKINCLYIGTLYYDIRNPEYLFKICENLTDENIQFYIIGNKIGFKKNYFDDWRKRLGKKVHFIERLGEEQIHALLERTNILINIGNSVSNQIPGKIFDYIASGKPIINLYKFDGCPSLKYLDKYPYKINISEKESLENNLEKVKKFILSNYKNEIDFSEIKKVYKKYTPSEVIVLLRKILDEIK